MKNPRLEEQKIIKDIRNLFKLKEEQNDTAIKYKKKVFRLKKEVKHIVLRKIMNLSECEKEENYYKPERVNNFWN